MTELDNLNAMAAESIAGRHADTGRHFLDAELQYASRCENMAALPGSRISMLIRAQTVSAWRPLIGM